MQFIVMSTLSLIKENDDPFLCELTARYSILQTSFYSSSSNKIA